MIISSDRRNASGALFSNQMALNGARCQQQRRRVMANLEGVGLQHDASLIDDVSRRQHQPAEESVVMRSKVIDLDKNRIKCGRSKLWSRPLSFSGFFKKSLSQGSIQLRPSRNGGGGVARYSAAYTANHGTDPNGNELSGRSAKLDLNMIRKLEDELYKRDHGAQHDEGNAEAKDFHDFYFCQRVFDEKKTFSSDTSAYRGDGKAVLVVDSQDLEPMLLKRPLSTDDSLLQTRSEALENSHLADPTNKSIIIVDNSEFYPVLMRYDINSELVNRQLREESRKRNQEKLKITTRNGGFLIKSEATSTTQTSSGSNNSDKITIIPLSASERTTVPKDLPSSTSKILTTRDKSTACFETKNINNNNHAVQQKKLVVNTRPPPPGGPGSGDRTKKVHSNLFQRFLLQRRSLNLSVRRRKRHECHFRPPPGYPSSDDTSLPDSKSIGNNKLKFEYLKKMQKYDLEIPSTANPHLSVNSRTTSVPDLSSRKNWKSEHFLQHLQRVPYSWSTGDLSYLSQLMSSSKNFENIFESASDNLSRLSAIVISSSSNGSPSSGSLTSSSSSSGASRMQSLLANHYNFLQCRERSANRNISRIKSNPTTGGNPRGMYNVVQPVSGNPLRKKSSSFRGVLKRNNTTDVVNTWIFRKR